MISDFHVDFLRVGVWFIDRVFYRRDRFLRLLHDRVGDFFRRLLRLVPDLGRLLADGLLLRMQRGRANRERHGDK